MRRHAQGADVAMALLHLTAEHRIQQLLLTPAGLRMCPSLTVLPRLPASPASWRHNVSLLAAGELLPLQGAQEAETLENR